MKIAIISTYDLSKISKKNKVKYRPVTWTENLAKSLVKYGAEVHIIVGVSPKEKIENYFIINNIHFHIFKTSGRFSPYFFYFYELLKVKKILRKIDPDIVHGQGSENHSNFSAIFSGYPNVITVHGVLNEIFKEKNGKYFLPRLLEKIVLLLAKNIIIINPYIETILKEYLKKFYFKKNYYHIENPISKEFFKTKAIKKKNKIIKILYCGVFRERKGLKDILKSLVELKARNVNFKLYITGIIGADKESKSYFKEIEEICKSKLNSYYELLGYIPNEQMPNLMGKMDFFVSASYAETAPMVIAEAMVSGLPVIAYDVGGIKYMIKSGVDGFVVPAKNINYLRDAILTLILDEKLRIEMGLNAFNAARKLYHPDLIASKTLNAYSEIIKGKKNG